MKKGIKAVSLALLLVLFGVLTFFTRPVAKAEPDIVSIGSIADWDILYNNVRDGNYTSETIIKLTADLNFDEAGTTIKLIGGKSGMPFKSIFDGDGHTITGKINLTNTDAKSSKIFGLFSTTDGATIKNLNLTLSYDYGNEQLLNEDPSEFFKNVVNDGHIMVGALIGQAYNYTTVENCTIQSSVIKTYHNPDITQTLENIGGLVAKAENSYFKNCSVKSTGINVQFEKLDSNFNMNIGEFIGLSNANTFENCSIESNGDFISLNLLNSCSSGSSSFSVNIGGLIGKAIGENKLYHSDLLLGNDNPVIELKNSSGAGSSSEYNIGGFIGSAEYSDSEGFKGNLITSSIVSEFILDYYDTFTKGATINFGGVIGNNPATKLNNPLITVINSSISTSCSPNVGDNVGILAGIDNGNGIYYDVFPRNIWNMGNFGGSGSAKTYKEINVADENFTIDSGARVNGSATNVDVLNYNALQEYGPTGSVYKNIPSKVKADFENSGAYVLRKSSAYTLADLCRTIEYYYSETVHPQITWIKGSNAHIDYDTSVTYDHYEFAEGNVWYTDNTYTTAADLEEIEASADTLTVYPKLQPKKNTISLEDLAGRIANNDADYTKSATISYEGTTLNESLILPIVKGYVFDGFYVYELGEAKIEIIDKNGNLVTTNETYFTDGKWTYANDLELRAKWEVIKYTINFDINGGDGVAPGPQVVEYSDSVKLNSSYQGNKPNYSRKGWTYTIGTETYTILENNPLKPILDALDLLGETSIKLIANWVQERNITVTNGNAYASTLNDANSITVEETGTTVYVKGDPKDCQTVTGWTTNNNLVVTEVNDKPGYWQFTMPNVDVELTPVYGPAHTLQKTNEVAATCESFGHLEYYQCSVCNKYFNNVDGAPEHEIADIDVWLAENGDGYLAPLGHDLLFNRIVWTDTLAQAIYACSRDSYEVGYDCAVTHEILIPSTCTSVGTTRYTATYESHSDTKDIENIPMVSHNYEWVVDQEATYYASGIKHEECTMCHDKRNENTEIPILTCTHEDCTKHDRLEPTCLVAGHKEYYECNTCSMLLDKVDNDYVEIPDLDLWKAESGNGYLAPLGHEWNAPTYEWNQDECTAKRVCTRDDSHTETEVVHGTYVKDIDANCENNEKGHYTVVFTNPAFTDQVSTQVEKENTALGHDYHVIYAWNEDKTKCIASNECSRCNSKVLLEEVDAEYTKVSDATCTKNEVGKMTATFTVQGLENQSTPNFEKENTKGHVFGDPTYVWTNGECTATRVCARDESHTETETVQGVYSVVTPATCLTNEIGKYTATFTNPAFTDQESSLHELVNTALGHDYVFTSIEWTSFTAQAIYTCSRDNAHVMKYDCTVTSEVTKVATCQEKGVRTYTATYENHTSTKTEELNLVSHALTHIEKLDATHDAEGHIEYYKCSVCNKLFEDSNASHEITLQQTILPKLVRVTVEGATIKNATGNILDLKPGDQVEIEANEPVKGQEFKGWALSEGGAIISSDKTLKITIGSDIRYYAVYGPIEKKGLSTGTLIGIIAGASALVGGAVVLLIVLKKKKQPKAN